MLTENKKRFPLEHLLVRICSPTLCGIKPASLAAMSAEDFECCKECLSKTSETLQKQGKQIVPVKRQENRVLLFVLDLDMLTFQLKKLEIKDYLSIKGYNKNWKPQKVIQVFLKRLANNTEFPHEVGIFLGYPLEDVIAFEENPKQSCKFCGVWKVYNNVEAAKKTFRDYDECCQMCKTWFAQGYSIPRVIKKYTSFRKKKAI